MSDKQTFQLIIEKYKKCFRAGDKETPEYLENFCTFALEYTDRSQDKFRRALKLILETQSVFPSIPDLKRAVEALPKKPIDHIAACRPDGREIRGCTICEHLGWIQGEDSFGYSTVCKCPNCDGKGLSIDLPTKSQIMLRGYRKFKEKRG